MQAPTKDDTQLSENAILYISSGFDGPYIMQVIVSRAISPREYQLCLTDGRLYIGGKYASEQKLNIPMYSIVKIQCKFNSRWSPIQITYLEVLSTSIKMLIGKSPATLHDYFQQQKQSSKSIYNGSCSNHSQQSVDANKCSEQMVPRKRVKLTVQPLPINPIAEQQHPTNSASCQTQKINIQSEINLENLQNAQTQSLKFKSDSQSEFQPSNPNIHQINSKQQSSQNNIRNQIKNAKNVIEDKSDSESLILVTRTQPKIYVASQHEVVINKSLVKKNQTHNVYISDLYERMPRWKILCRVVSLRTFMSAKGKKCSIMLLIDQKGDEIKAIYYYNKNGINPADKIQQGKVYSFTGGEVSKPSDAQYFSLQIVLDEKCHISQYQQIFIYPYSSKKSTKFKDLLNCRQLVNVIGILKSCELAPAINTNYNSKPKVKGVICNPTELYQIQFSKSLYAGEKELTVGSVYVLYNFSIVQTQNAIKLLGSNNSFIIKITDEDMQYNKAKDYPQYQQLYKIRKQLKAEGQKWKKYQYYNLSQVKYSKRTIQQMKSITNQTDSSIYSQILVSITDIKLKKQYMACPVCKRSTIQQEQILFQCLKCKKIVDPYPTLIISMVLADATGSFQVDVIGQKVQIFIDKQPSQFCGMSTQDRQWTLLIAKYSQFIVKLKTEKKGVRQLCHSIQDASKQEVTNSMQQIRRRTVQSKLKLQQKWDYFN